MILYFPMVIFTIDPDDKDVCDYVMQGFTKEEDAKELYPEAEIISLEFPDNNPNLN